MICGTWKDFVIISKDPNKGGVVNDLKIEEENEICCLIHVLISEIG